ncbi:Non-specific phospholipase C3 [Vitis vinifera]|uniref:Non-specific phospholipase C3 n=1 Tax=Vitis vinifera TaxID=29760 RepID=A0A438G5P0_VITVI|nr:Non-specific phospholipase C3 [Vitis vinifera]
MWKNFVYWGGWQAISDKAKTPTCGTTVCIIHIPWNLRKLKYIDNFHQFDLDFKRHCEEGKLPNYVHVYEALRASPQWNDILFVIIYDEHGGFYDHVPTPVTGVPSPDDIVGPEPYNFSAAWTFRAISNLGVRALVHSGTVKKLFNLKEFLTKRDAWAGTFEVTLPEPVKLRETEAKDEAELSEFQQELVQMAAALKGDHRKDIYPHKLVQDMNVSDATKYVNNAFNQFLDECQKAKTSGTHDSSDIVLCPQTPPKRTSSKSFAHKLFSCLNLRSLRKILSCMPPDSLFEICLHLPLEALKLVLFFLCIWCPSPRQYYNLLH